MSAIRGDGIKPWIKLSVTQDDVKTPRRIQHIFEKKPQNFEEHGLIKFFNKSKQLLTEPYTELDHGKSISSTRPWYT
jgi:hypothetical protein